jgi:hypothetical protein
MTTNIYPSFIALPDYVLEDERLLLIDKVLYSYFLGFALHRKEVFPSNAKLCSILKIKERYLQRRMKHLEKLNFIKRVVLDNKRCIEVNLEDKKIIRLEGQEGVACSAPPPVLQATPPRPTGHPYNKADIKDYKTHSRGGEISSISESQYQEFLSAHKSSEGKAEGLDEWNKLTQSEKLEAIKHTSEQYATYPFGHRYVRKITNYIRGKDWRNGINQTILDRGPNQPKSILIADSKPTLTPEQLEEMTLIEHTKHIERMKSKTPGSYMGSHNRLTARPERALKSIKTYLMEAKNDSQ